MSVDVMIVVVSTSTPTATGSITCHLKIQHCIRPITQGHTVHNLKYCVLCLLVLQVFSFNMLTLFAISLHVLQIFMHFCIGEKNKTNTLTKWIVEHTKFALQNI